MLYALKKSSLSTLQTLICANEVRNSTENFTLFFSLKKKKKTSKERKTGDHPVSGFRLIDLAFVTTNGGMKVIRISKGCSDLKKNREM